MVFRRCISGFFCSCHYKQEYAACYHVVCVYTISRRMLWLATSSALKLQFIHDDDDDVDNEDIEELQEWARASTLPTVFVMNEFCVRLSEIAVRDNIRIDLRKNSSRGREEERKERLILLSYVIRAASFTPYTYLLYLALVAMSLIHIQFVCFCVCFFFLIHWNMQQSKVPVILYNAVILVCNM